jgi:hypothetical protein
MGFGLFAALVAVHVTTTSSGTEQAQALTYRSTKTVDALQKCLTLQLAELGEVVAMKLDGHTTALVLRNIPEGAMTIELAPGSVSVTSKPARHTTRLIKSCL